MSDDTLSSAITWLFEKSVFGAVTYGPYIMAMYAPVSTNYPYLRMGASLGLFATIGKSFYYRALTNNPKMGAYSTASCATAIVRVTSFSYIVLAAYYSPNAIETLIMLTHPAFLMANEFCVQAFIM